MVLTKDKVAHRQGQSRRQFAESCFPAGLPSSSNPSQYLSTHSTVLTIALYELHTAHTVSVMFTISTLNQFNY